MLQIILHKARCEAPSAVQCSLLTLLEHTAKQIFVLVLALVDQHALLSVPHLEKDRSCHRFLLSFNNIQPYSTAGITGTHQVKQARSTILASSRKATVLELSFINTSVAPGLPPLSILRISLEEAEAMTHTERQRQ